MASKRENKIALAKARRERGIISSQNRILDTIKKEEERMAFNQAMGSNVAAAKPLTSAQEGRFYEATGLDNASNPQEAIKGEILNTGLSFVQVANALANKADDATGNKSILGQDFVARGAGQVLGRIGPYGTGTYDTDKAIDTYTKWGTGNVTKGDVANVALTGTGIKAGVLGFKGAKGLIPAARSVKASGVPIPVMGLGVGGGAGIIRVGGDKPFAARQAAERARLRAEDRAAAEAALPPEEQLPQGILEQMKGKPAYMSPEEAKRLQDEAAAATPKDIDVLVPTQRTESGDWSSVEIAGQDELTGLTNLDPSEVRALAFGGLGSYVKGTPLESLSDLRIPKEATRIRAVYTPPSAEEILKSMNKTDSAVKNRPNVKTWERNTYTIEDAQALLDRWKAARDAFEEANGRPLPWELQADVPNPNTGKIEAKRIFGQDVEHAVPVNQGGTGAADELVLLPTIGNTGKGDASWEAYAAANPENWASLMETFYGNVRKY